MASEATYQDICTESPVNLGSADINKLIRQKGNCEDCPYYYDCPRMRGEEICHNYFESVLNAN